MTFADTGKHWNSTALIQSLNTINLLKDFTCIIYQLVRMFLGL